MYIIFFKEKTIAPPHPLFQVKWLVPYKLFLRTITAFGFYFSFAVDPKSTFCECVREDNKSSMSDRKLNSYSFLLDTHPPLNSIWEILKGVYKYIEK